VKELFTSLGLPVYAQSGPIRSRRIVARDDLQDALDLLADEPAQIETIIDGILDAWPVVAYETPIRRETWPSFAGRQHGSKHPVHLLEPRVAALVKAYNAAGARTSLSCGGHHRANHRTPYISFNGELHAAWARAINRLLGLNRIEGRWRSDTLRLRPQVEPERQLSFLDTDEKIPRRCMAGLTEAATQVYDRRIELREIRRALIHELERASDDRILPDQFQRACEELISLRQPGPSEATPRRGEMRP
jgi:hypothetical protein